MFIKIRDSQQVSTLYSILKVNHWCKRHPNLFNQHRGVWQHHLLRSLLRQNILIGFYSSELSGKQVFFVFVLLCRIKRMSTMSTNGANNLLASTSVVRCLYHLLLWTVRRVRAQRINMRAIITEPLWSCQNSNCCRDSGQSRATSLTRAHHGQVWLDGKGWEEVICIPFASLSLTVLSVVMNKPAYLITDKNERGGISSQCILFHVNVYKHNSVDISITWSPYSWLL